MCSPCREAALRIGFAIALVPFAAVSAHARVLRVCADPENLPFSNQAGAGFENKLAELVARDLNASLEYTWWPERKSFVKKSLDAGRCDVILGIATAVDTVLATKPYYRSSYVFVSRKDRHRKISALSDPRLADWRIGIHVVGDDYAPPAHALARRGISANLVGFSLFGAEGERDPASKIITAVDKGDVDVAIVWGPFAGYFAKSARNALEVTPVTPSMWMGLPFTYDISMAVRRDDAALKGELDRVLERECHAIGALLSEYGIPTLSEEESKCDGSQQPVSVSSR